MTTLIKPNLSSFDNSWYNQGGTPLKRFLWYFINILFFKNAWNPCNRLKIELLKLFGAKLGSNIIIKPAINIKYPWNLSVGDNVWIGENVWIDNLAKVEISNNVCISQGAMLLCGNHNYKKTSFDLIVGKITLKEGSWVGAKSIVCPNVTLHENSILTVGSIAVQDLEPNGIYQGNPAKKIRTRIIEE